MKFLCDNCKAKYQIPDEKIAGRTLRMKCRKCGHNIIIRGPGGAGSSASKRPAAPRRRSAPGPAPRRRRSPGSQAGPRPRKTALGAEFRSGGSLAPDSGAPRAVPEWHVAINDVPVGPVKREEVGRKIGTGAVDGESLVWREGFDDWRPLKEVPELLGLLEAQRKAPPLSSPPAKSSRSNVIPIGGRLGAAPGLDELDGDDEKTVMAPAPAGLRSPGPAPAPVPAVPKPVTVPKPVVPAPAVAARTRPAASATPAPDESASEPRIAPLPPAFVPETEPASDPFASPAAPPMSQEAAVTPPPSRRRAVPVGAWIAMVGAGAFGVALAIMIAPRLLEDDEEPVAVAPEPEPTPQVAPELEIPMENEAEAEAAPEDEGEAAEPEDPADETPSQMTARRATMAAMAPATSGMNDGLSAEQRELLARYGDTGGSSLSMINVPGSTMTSNRPPLDGDAVRRVVGARTNQQSLRRCYERAARGRSDAPNVRIDVQVNVGASGVVTRVDATTSNDFGGLTRCIETAVRRFRFPPSAGGRARFPVVFSGG